MTTTATAAPIPPPRYGYCPICGGRRCDPTLFHRDERSALRIVAGRIVRVPLVHPRPQPAPTQAAT